MEQAASKIIHIDMDAFYAAVEQRDNPQYLNKPIIVGGKPDSRGVVATCSYEARKFGIHSAMPSSQAYRLCPQAIFVKPRFEAYREASAIIRSIFARYSEIVEPLSLDEAYLDVSENRLFQGSAKLLAKQIKLDILQQTRLIASAGVSCNKFLAKIASDLGKPDGLYLITPEQAASFVENLAIGKFHGIGPATEKKMHELGISNGRDLKQMPLYLLQQHFGKSAQYYYDIARGIDRRPVNACRARKSIGVETTFASDIESASQVLLQLQALLQQALGKLSDGNLTAYTLTIKIKFSNFVQITRSRTLAEPISESSSTQLLLNELLKNSGIERQAVRLLGVTLSSLDGRQQAQSNFRQLDLFDFAGFAEPLVSHHQPSH
jgi:DNA polymerase-4